MVLPANPDHVERFTIVVMVHLRPLASAAKARAFDQLAPLERGVGYAVGVTGLHGGSVAQGA